MRRYRCRRQPGSHSALSHAYLPIYLTDLGTTTTYPISSHVVFYYPRYFRSLNAIPTLTIIPGVWLPGTARLDSPLTRPRLGDRYPKPVLVLAGPCRTREAAEPSHYLGVAQLPLAHARLGSRALHYGLQPTHKAKGSR
jgi:hypothetical protein